ncbi:MAG TPA: MBL fold metallo-hydrolase [Anaerolineae bacterium]|nr:MBL fold metallo-hydrolase [Anaerolineae bacterium]HOQ98556.1 MBL fold metallo-hydrolase [Anaerolineae bacterium]HPL27036.1 MBL fold metallo-hydrolase [Anaerolineae bacterium]
MRLTVFGNSGSFPGPDSACAGYLLEADGLQILLDCGNGVLARLQRYFPIEQLDALVVSHLHFDHMADLPVLKYGLESKVALGQCLEPLQLFAPATPEEVRHTFASEVAFASTTIEDGMLTQLGSVSLSFVRMDHPVETYAVVVSAEDKRFVYSGDTLFNRRLIDAASGADLLLCEATAVKSLHTASGDIPHLTARQAGEVAAQAGVRQLLLTHFWYETPREEYVAEARQAFAGAAASEEFVSYDI